MRENKGLKLEQKLGFGVPSLSVVKSQEMFCFQRAKKNRHQYAELCIAEVPWMMKTRNFWEVTSAYSQLLGCFLAYASFNPSAKNRHFLEEFWVMMYPKCFHCGYWMEYPVFYFVKTSSLKYFKKKPCSNSDLGNE